MIKRSLVCSFLLFASYQVVATNLETEKQLEFKLIKAGAKLYSPNEEEQFLLDQSRYFYVSYDHFEKPIFVNIHSSAKDKKIIYKTAYNNIQDIQDVLDIYPKYNPKSVYEKPTSFQDSNRYFDFNLLPSVGYEQTDISPLQELYQSTISTNSSNRFSLKAVMPTSRGIDLAVALNYQNLYWENESEDVKLTSISLGPYIQIPIFKNSNFNPTLNLGAELSLSSNSKSSLYKDEFSTTLWHLGLSDTFNSKIGPFIGEIFYRNHEFILEKTNRAIENRSQTYRISSVGLSLGYRWDFQL